MITEPEPDETGDERAVALLRQLGAARMSHPGGTLLVHLRRVERQLAAWEARPALRLAGLCHAFYGTDVIATDGELAPGDSYNKARGDEVIARGRAFLDEHFPLASGSHADATSYAVDDQGLAVTVKDDAVRLADVCLAQGPVERVEVTVHKPSAPIALDFADVSVTVVRP